MVEIDDSLICKNLPEDRLYFLMQNIDPLFDVENIRHLVSWDDVKSMEGDGYTIYKTLEDLKQDFYIKSRPSWSSGQVYISLFEPKGLESFFEKTPSGLVRFQRQLPENRFRLTKQELELVYKHFMPKYVELFTPQQIAEDFMPLYFKKY